MRHPPRQHFGVSTNKDGGRIVLSRAKFENATTREFFRAAFCFPVGQPLSQRLWQNHRVVGRCEQPGVARWQTMD
jgi:hypothetical protein